MLLPRSLPRYYPANQAFAAPGREERIPNRVSTPGEDDGDVGANQLRGRSGKQLRSIPRVSVLEDDGLSFYVAALSKCGEEGVPVLRRRLGGTCRARDRQMTDPRQTCHLLCPGGERRGEEATSHARDKGPPVDHSIT